MPVFAFRQHSMNSSQDGAGDADVLAALRRATASRHTSLDIGLPLAGDAPGLADYAAHLQLLRDWLVPVQAWLDGFEDGPQGAGALPPAGRLALIEADLAEPCLAQFPFTVRPSTPVIPGKSGIPFFPPEPHSPGWPGNASPAYRWGACYVIEGSQLGGAVLYQRLHGRLAPHPLRYLRGEPGGPGPRWRAFMLALRAHVHGQADIADACAGACDAFDAILALAFPQAK
jgi:heme oxygenase